MMRDPWDILINMGGLWLLRFGSSHYRDNMLKIACNPVMMLASTVEDMKCKDCLIFHPSRYGMVHTTQYNMTIPYTNVGLINYAPL